MTAHLNGRSLSAVEYSRPPLYVLGKVAHGRGRKCVVQFSRRSKVDMFVAEAAVSQPLSVCLPWLRLVLLFRRLPTRHVAAQAIRKLIRPSLSLYRTVPAATACLAGQYTVEYMATIVAVSFLVPLPCADSFRPTLGFRICYSRQAYHSFHHGWH